MRTGSSTWRWGLAFGLSLGLSVGAVACDRSGGGTGGGEPDATSPSNAEASGPSPGSRESTASADEGEESEESTASASSNTSSSGEDEDIDTSLLEESPDDEFAIDDLPAASSQQDALMKKAKTAFLKRDMSAAEPHFRKVIETGDFSAAQASAYIALSRLLLKNGESEEAVELLESVPKRGRKLFEIRRLLAEARAASGAHREGAKLYTSLVDEHPEKLSLYPALGHLYDQMGKSEKSKELGETFKRRVETLARIVESPDSTEAEQRLEALNLLSPLRNQRVRRAVEAALDDPDARVRSRATGIVPDIDLEGGKARLEAMAETDDNESVQRAAREALQKYE